MANSVEKENVYDDGNYVVKKSRKHNVLSFIICLLIAFVIWLYAANKENNFQNTSNDETKPVETVDTSVQPNA